MPAEKSLAQSQRLLGIQARPLQNQRGFTSKTMSNPKFLIDNSRSTVKIVGKGVASGIALELPAANEDKESESSCSRLPSPGQFEEAPVDGIRRNQAANQA